MAITRDDELEYFAAPGSTTQLGRHAGLAAELPSDPGALGKIVRAWCCTTGWRRCARRRTHARARRHAGHRRSDDARSHLGTQLGPVAGEASCAAPDGTRSSATTSRCCTARCSEHSGSHPAPDAGSWATPGAGKWIDHWVVEYWDGHNWHLHDPQLGRDDLTDDEFRNAADAWKLCRSGDADPAIHGNGELWAWDEFRGSLVNDVGALNKVEVGGWYWCDLLKVEPLDEPHPSVDARLDVFADLASDVDGSRNLHEAFERAPAIRPPAGVIER